MLDSRMFKVFQSCRIFHTYLLKMNKAYLRRLNDTDRFEFSFSYIDTNLRINRQFNFNRKLTEDVETFLSRVTTNFDKVLLTKLKKKQKENKTPIIKKEEIQTNVCLLLDNIEVSKDTICKDVFLPGKDIVLQLESMKYEILVDCPWINNISLPTSMLATFPVYPLKFETVFTDKELSTFVWSKSKDKTTWTEINTDFICIPSNDVIGNYLKLSCTPKNSSSEGPSIEIISDCTVKASPGKCPFETRHEFTKERAIGNEFRVITYNILADCYSNKDTAKEVLFSYCPPNALSMDYRKQLFIKEIMGYQADIICLQEVDNKIYKYDLEPILSHLNYGSNISLKRTPEGVAFFYKKNRFKLLESYRIVFSRCISTEPIVADIWKKIATNEKLSKRMLDISTILQINVVESLERDDVLIVANTHLYFHPDADHIRLLHGGIAIKYLEYFSTTWKKKLPNKRISVLFCGDFNSAPENGVYKLFTEGSVPKDFIDFRSIKEEEIKDVELKQSFKLASAYGTPKYTNFTADFADCLDYIFYDTESLSVAQVVPLPSHEELTENTALPSVVFPSDHIALVADLKWS